MCQRTRKIKYSTLGYKSFTLDRLSAPSSLLPLRTGKHSVRWQQSLEMTPARIVLHTEAKMKEILINRAYEGHRTGEKSNEMKVKIFE